VAGIISLTTDFSTSDPYVGVMKGVIKRHAPNICVIDLAHDIAPQDISEAAFVIATSYRYFPEGTVHLVVVDPGVGSTRRRIAMRCGAYFFVGPDNGVFSYPIRDQGLCECVEIVVNEQQRGLRGVTFEGRDVFAPVAAKLATGVPLADIGPALSDPVTLPTPRPKAGDSFIEGKVIYVDHFGNCVTNIELADVEKLNGKLTVYVGGFPIGHLGYCYSDAAVGEALALVNSVDHVEIAVNHGNASEELNIKVGTPIRIEAVA